ncbi:hypothetical protein KW801_03000 [Candidatus Saccharibacteria bacterium]|nr:hypothetical protein [Candidatus Saccharibacteria bacterium]
MERQLMLWKSLLILTIVFGALPSTTNYQLNSYGFGSGGTANSTTPTYSLEGISGELSGQTSTTSTYSLKPGFIETQQANVPKIATFDNGSGRYYNKLHFIIDEQSNPSDALYALQISTTSNFSSGVNYVKSDLTIGPTLVVADYQTYSAFGGASGTNIIGLTPSTTYYLRAKATQGQFTESGYGPSASASTVNPSISFTISPTTVSMGNLLPNTVTDATSSISLTFDTNANSGGDIYLSGQNSGLYSATTSNTITAVSGDLSSLSRGFGARVTSTGQTSGGPLSALSPYNGSSNNVGLTDSTIRKMITTSAQVNSGTASVLLKAKVIGSDPAANDYKEILTMLASASF